MQLLLAICARTVFLLLAGTLVGQSIGDSPAGDNSGSGNIPSVSASVAPFVLAVKPLPPAQTGWVRPERGSGVNWSGVLSQSFFFLGVEHSFRFLTEQGTRDAIVNGHYVQGYWDAVGNLHGWADGDPFYVNYVGHPMQGAVTGYIWNQNDGRYSDAEFGANRHYWKSRLRAMAFSYIYSVQFEIGALSEASIGKVQAYYPQQGFVDHVITPVVGTGWMIAEDALDQYLIKRVESRVENPFINMMVRSWLNPSRSMANVMRLKVPWSRDNRPGIFSPYRTAFLRQQKAEHKPTPYDPTPQLAGRYGVSSFEFTFAYRQQQFLGNSGAGACLGGGGEAAFRLDPQWQLILDVNGCKMWDLGTNWSGDTLGYAVGPRWSPRPTGKWSPYAQFLVGGMKITQEQMFPELKEQLIAAAGPDLQTQKSWDMHSQYTKDYDANGFAVTAGGGIDYRVNPGLALRLASLEYRKSWLPTVNGKDYNNGLAFNVAMVVRMGTW